MPMNIPKPSSLSALMLKGALLTALLLPAACATPETRVRNALIDAGVREPIAACMADRMVDQLSWAQLRRLEELKHLKGAKVENTSLSEFVRRTRSLQDPEILGVVSSSGFICWTKDKGF